MAQLPQVYLKPGEVHMCRGSAVLKTVLGSCVGVTFWLPRLRIGALCHGILPEGPHGATSPEGYRYVDFAVRDLVNRFEQHGARRSEIEVKVFGGADVLSTCDSRRTRTVGQANLEVAAQVIEEQSLELKGADTGGLTGRTIRFQTWDGHVFVRRLARMNKPCGQMCLRGELCPRRKSVEGKSWSRTTGSSHLEVILAQ